MSSRGLRQHLCRAVSAVALCSFVAGVAARAQTVPINLSFEVATVKPVLVDASHPFTGKRFWAHIYPDRATYWTMTPVMLLGYVYSVPSYQVTGPDWASNEHFDIEGTFPEGARKKDEKGMLLSLLSDRFKLAFHVEEKQLDGYVLLVGKHGERLKPSLPDPAPLPKADSNSEAGPVKSSITKNADGSNTVDLGKRGTITSWFDPDITAIHNVHSKMTMNDLVSALSSGLGGVQQKIADETGLKGNYQIAYDCPLGRAQSMSGADSGGSLSSEMLGSVVLNRSLDAMGLKLEKRKLPQKIYVIDHVERPSEN